MCCRIGPGSLVDVDAEIYADGHHVRRAIQTTHVAFVDHPVAIIVDLITNFYALVCFRALTPVVIASVGVIPARFTVTPLAFAICTQRLGMRVITTFTIGPACRRKRFIETFVDTLVTRPATDVVAVCVAGAVAIIVKPVANFLMRKTYTCLTAVECQPVVVVPVCVAKVGTIAGQAHWIGIRNNRTNVAALAAVCEIRAEIKSLVGYSITVVVMLVADFDPVMRKKANVLTAIRGILVYVEIIFVTISHFALAVNTRGKSVRERTCGAFIRVPAVVVLTNKFNAELVFTVAILLALEEAAALIADLGKRTIGVVVAFFFNQTTSD